MCSSDLDLLKARDVEEILRENPSLMEMWVARGQDQRYAGGWGIERLEGQFRIVSYGTGQKVKFDDPVKGCAEFVVRYLCFIGDIQVRAGRRARSRHAA